MITQHIFNGQHTSYTIQSRIGAGGMAVVYYAVEQNTNKQVAIKQVYEWLTTSPEAVTRFNREVAVITRLSHPAIVPIIDSGEHEGLPFMVMPYYERGSLADVIQQQQEVTIGESLIRLSQIASALDYAHSKNIIHRDLKLENCLVNTTGNVLLADFGMAYVADATRLTFTGDLRGTPHIMSPEQSRGDKTITHAVDIYSLTVLAYLLITGYYPFTSDETLALLNMHIMRLAPPPSQVNLNLPKDIDDVLYKGLAKSADERYQTATELIQALDAVLAGYATLPVQIHMGADNPNESSVDMRAFNEMSNTEPPITKVFDSSSLPVSTPPTEPASNPDRRWLIAGILVLILLAGGGFIAVAGSNLFAPLPDDGQPIAMVVDNTATPTQTVTSTDMPTEAPTETNTVTHTATITVTSTSTKTATTTSSPTTTDTPTLTHTPSSTPSPTITPTSLPGIGGIISGDQGANVRRGANSSYGIVTFLETDESIRLIGRNLQGTWLQAILPDDRQGWIFGDLINYADEDIFDLPVTWTEPTATPVPTSTPVPQIITQPQSNSGGNSSSNNNSGSSSNGGNNSNNNNGGSSSGGGNNNGGNSNPNDGGGDSSGGGGDDDNDSGGGLGGTVRDLVDDLLP